MSSTGFDLGRLFRRTVVVAAVALPAALFLAGCG
jgi:hypothetical protein